MIGAIFDVARGVRRAVVVVTLALLLIYVLQPAFEGFHVGYDPHTDNVYVNRLIQWGKYEPPGSSSISTSPSGDAQSTGW